MNRKKKKQRRKGGKRCGNNQKSLFENERLKWCRKSKMMTAVRNKIHTNQREGRNETKLLENIKPSPSSSSLQHVILREKYDSAEN